MDSAISISESQAFWSLFSSAFIASTVAPGGSEVILAYLVKQGLWSPLILLAIATIGNTLGALTTIYLGRLAGKKWPLDDPRHARHQRSIEAVRKHGYPVLLLSWLPLIGDGLCFAAGWLRMSIPRGVLFIATGKTFRYLAVISIVRHL